MTYIKKQKVWEHIYYCSEIPYNAMQWAGTEEGWCDGSITYIDDILANNGNANDGWRHWTQGHYADKMPFVSIPVETYPPDIKYWINDYSYYTYEYFSIWDRLIDWPAWYTDGACIDDETGFDIILYNASYKIIGGVNDSCIFNCGGNCYCNFPAVNEDGEIEKQFHISQNARYMKIDRIYAFAYDHGFHTFTIGTRSCGVRIYKVTYSEKPFTKNNFFPFIWWYWWNENCGEEYDKNVYHETYKGKDPKRGEEWQS